MIGLLLNQLVWAALFGTIAILIALLAGRMRRLSPTFKVWICRIAFLKLALGLIPVSFATLVLPRAPLSASQGSSLRSDYLLFLFFIWLLGSAIVFANLTVSAQQTLRFVASARLASTALRDEVLKIARDFGHTLSTTVLVHDSIDFPYAVACGKPILVLPSGIDAHENRTSVAHEIAHIRHADLKWGLLYRVIAAIFWFHPLAFKLEREACLWQEAAADRLACGADTSRVKSHAHAILAASAARSGSGPELSSALAGDATTLTRRLKSLYSCQRSFVLSLTFVPLLVIALVPLGASYLPPTRLVPLSIRADPEEAHTSAPSEPQIATMTTY